MADDENASGDRAPSAGGGPTSPPDLGEQVHKVIPEDEAAAAGLVIGGMLEDLSAEEEADPSPYSKPWPKSPSEGELELRQIVEDDYDDRVAERSHRGAFLWILLIALGAAAIAAAFIMMRTQQPEATGASPQDAIAGAPAPAAPNPQGGAAIEGVPGDCAVAPTSLKVASTETYRDRGVNDPAMFVVQWDAGVINNSTEAILVTAKIASSDSGASSGWEGSYTSVAPGEAHLWPTNYVTNNAQGAAGATTWQYVDQVLAVRDAPQCGDLLVSPTDETAKAAIRAEIPRLPANAQLPAR